MLLSAAEDAGPGGLGALIFVVFFIAAIVIFIAMSRSMKRMRSNVDRGNFGDPDADPGAPTEAGSGAGGVAPDESPERPRGGPEV